MKINISRVPKILKKALTLSLSIGLLAIQNYKGQSVTRLLVVSNFDQTLRILDTATYAQLATRSMTFSGGGFQGIHGLAKRPSTGVFYGAVNDGAGSFSLVTINPITGSVTSVGTLGNRFSSLTFNGNGTLLGVTGSGGTPGSTVYRINVTNAAKTAITSVNNVYGQVICYNPVDNKVYHWTGGNSVSFRSYDTSFVSSTTIAIGAPSSEVTSAVYKTGSVFTTSDWDLNYRKVRAAGGSSVYVSYSAGGYYPKGMAYITCSRSITTGTYCANQAPVTLTMSGTPGATYQWYKNNIAIIGATLISLPTATSGVGYYKCRINDGCGQDSLAPGITVSVVAIPTVAISGPTLLCSGQSITLTGSSGGASQWYKNGVLVAGATSNTISVSLPGIYNMIKTNLNTCKDSAANGRVVVLSASPTIAVNSGSICSGNSFTMTPSGALTYTFSNGASVVTPTANASYSITGTSSVGCVSSNTAISSVTVNITPTVSSNSGSICLGESFTITPSGGNTYTISGGAAVVTPTANASFNIICTSSAGCVSSNTAVSNVSVNPLPNVSVNSGVICSGGSFTIIPTGANTYTISGGLAIVSPISNTTYSVTGTSSLGCLSPAPVICSVTVNSLPVITVNSGSICSGNSFTIVPSGAATYTISGGSSVVSPTSNSTYSVIGTSSLGCLGAASAISSVTVVALPSVSVNSGAVCKGQSFTLSPSGANSYSFSSGNAVVTPSTTSSYSVNGTNAQGCVSANAISTVTVNSLPNVTASSSNNTICVGETSTLSASGASSYVWNTTSTLVSLVVSPTTTTSYTVTGTDNNGCVNTSSVTQNVNACTSLASIARVDNIVSVYPNPNSGEFTLSANSDITLSIVNELGQLVKTVTLYENNKRSILLNELASGIYFVVGQNGGQVVREKIIVNK